MSLYEQMKTVCGRTNKCFSFDKNMFIFYIYTSRVDATLAASEHHFEHTFEDGHIYKHFFYV